MFSDNAGGYISLIRQAFTRPTFAAFASRSQPSRIPICNRQNLRRYLGPIVIESLISSKTRIKLLLKFFLHEGTRGYLRGLEHEFGESSNAIRLELNRFMKAGLLSSETVGNKRMFMANREHPLYSNLRQIVHKHVGLDRIIDTIVAQLGQLEQVYLTGAFARGLDDGQVDIVLIGEVDEGYLAQLVSRAERLIERRIGYRVLPANDLEAKQFKQREPTHLLLWDHQNPVLW